LQNRSAPHVIEGLPSFPITGAHAFLFHRGKPLQNRSVPHFIERLSEVFYPGGHFFYKMVAPGYPAKPFFQAL
jgi:hypothetical protein